MALQKEVWQRDIQEAFFADILFLKYGTDVSGSVLDGKVVHLPQSGALNWEAEKNRTTFPAVVVRRTDSEKTYSLGSFSTPPHHLLNAEQAELSYDKRKSVLADVKGILTESVSCEILHSWAEGLKKETHIIRTGSDRNVPATASSATGKRKALSELDFQKAYTKIMMQTKGNAKDLVALVPYTLMPNLQDVAASAFNPTLSILTDEERRSGFIGRLQNFLILPCYPRLVADNDGQIKAYKATKAATDNEVVLCWTKTAVEYAFGSIKMFQSENDPLYYGDIYSFEVRAGGARRRSDDAGVVAIVPTNVTP